MTEEIYPAPMHELILTMAAWRRLAAMAQEFDSKDRLAGAVILYYMSMAWDEAEKDLKEAEKELKKQIKKKEGKQ